MFPTPTAGDRHDPSIEDAKKRMTLTLRNFVKILPEGAPEGCLRGGLMNEERQRLIERSVTKMPTPTTRDWKGSGTIAALTRPLSPSLDAVVRFFPDDTENGKVILNGIKEKVKSGEITEDDLKAIFPTPSCTGMAGGTGACQKLQQLKDNGTITEEERKALQRGWNGGKLNPAWVEWLMGWPIGWTALKHLETVKSPLAPQRPS